MDQFWVAFLPPWLDVVAFAVEMDACLVLSGHTIDPLGPIGDRIRGVVDYWAGSTCPGRRQFAPALTEVVNQLVAMMAHSQICYLQIDLRSWSNVSDLRVQREKGGHDALVQSYPTQRHSTPPTPR